MWKCKRCKREFVKNNQSHSCVIYPAENHFKNKKLAKKLYIILKKEMRKNIGPFKIESLPCCIHFVSNYTFAAVFALKDRIRIGFASKEVIKAKHLKSPFKVSKNRFYNIVEISDSKDINSKLMLLLKKAYYLRKI